MKKAYLSIVTAIFLFSAFIPLFAQLADSPWPMYQHDAQHTGRSPFLGPQNPALKWSYKADGIISAPPAIGKEGIIYLVQRIIIFMQSNLMELLNGNSNFQIIFSEPLPLIQMD